MKNVKTAILLPAFFAILCGCSAGNAGGVQVFEIDTGNVVGKTTNSPFQRYRDMVIGIDDEHGQIAVIEWGDRISTVKIITIKPWKVSKYSVAATHLQGSIEGPMGFDFHRNCFIYVTDSAKKDKIAALVTIDLKDGKQQRFPATAEKGDWISDPIVSTADGVFYRAVGGNEDWLYHIAANSGSAKDIFHTKDTLRAWGLSGRRLYMLTTPRDEKRKDEARLTVMDHADSAQTEHILNWSSLEYATDGEHLMAFFPNERTLRRISITSPNTSQDFTVPSPREGFRVSLYDLACSQNQALLTESSPNSPIRKLVMLNLRANQVKERDITGYQSPVRAFRYDGKDYAILAE
jgi:hypothetical protein